jgi:hypothetical protein
MKSYVVIMSWLSLLVYLAVVQSTLAENGRSVAAFDPLPVCDLQKINLNTYSPFNFSSGCNPAPADKPEPMPVPPVYEDKPELYKLKGYTKWEQWCADKNLTPEQKFTIEVLKLSVYENDCLKAEEKLNQIKRATGFVNFYSVPVNGINLGNRWIYFAPGNLNGVRPKPHGRGDWWFDLQNLEPIAALAKVERIHLGFIFGDPDWGQSSRIKKYTGLELVCEKLQVTTLHLPGIPSEFPIGSCGHIKNFSAYSGSAIKNIDVVRRGLELEGRLKLFKKFKSFKKAEKEFKKKNCLLTKGIKVEKDCDFNRIPQFPSKN